MQDMQDLISISPSPSQEKNENIKNSLVTYTKKVCDQCETIVCETCDTNNLINLIKNTGFGKLPKHLREIYKKYKEQRLVA